MALFLLLSMTAIAFHPAAAMNTSLEVVDVGPRAPGASGSGPDCGTFVMDCTKAFGACNNACYWQNCIHGGDYTYLDNGERKDDGTKKMEEKQDANRAESGARTGAKRATCKVFPISQRIYDHFIDGEINWDYPNALKLETDEWPMAAMTQSDFDNRSPWPPRNSLRCIPKRENGSESGAKVVIICVCITDLCRCWRHLF